MTILFGLHLSGTYSFDSLNLILNAVEFKILFIIESQSCGPHGENHQLGSYDPDGKEDKATTELFHLVTSWLN